MSDADARIPIEFDPLGDALREPIPGVRLHLGYQLGLFFVTGAVVLLHEVEYALEKMSSAPLDREPTREDKT